MIAAFSSPKLSVLYTDLYAKLIHHLAAELDLDKWLNMDPQGLANQLSSLAFDVAILMPPNSAIAFLLGGVAMATGMRLSIAGCALFVSATLLTQFGLIEGIPSWLPPMALALMLLGVAQGACTVVLGEQASANVTSGLLTSLLLLLLWRAPGRAFGALGFITKMLFRRR